jgi:hypothetical protein
LEIQKGKKGKKDLKGKKKGVRLGEIGEEFTVDTSFFL